MTLTNLRRRVHEAAQPVEPEGRQSCAATDCPCIATVQVEGGRWCCSQHAFAMPDEWRRLTQALIDHEWLIAFIDATVLRIRRHQDWRGAAVAFWAGVDDACCPVAAGEDGYRHPEEGAAYVLRMRRELAARVEGTRRPVRRGRNGGNRFARTSPGSKQAQEAAAMTPRSRDQEGAGTTLPGGVENASNTRFAMESQKCRN
jgi:hypothetical protein